MVSTSEELTVTLHSTWRGIILSFLGAALLCLLAWALLASNGPTWVSVLVALVASGAVIVVLFDLPVATEFSRAGVVRRAPLRRHAIGWDRVTRLERQRVGLYRTRRGEVRGGLVAARGARKYTLVDVTESPQEFDRLRRVLGPDLSERLGLVAEQRPPEGQTPTWIYRRERWRIVG